MMGFNGYRKLPWILEFTSIRWGKKRYMRCPKCHKWSWFNVWDTRIGKKNSLTMSHLMYSPKKFDFKCLQTTNGLRQTNREEGKVHRATQEKRKEQQRRLR